MQLLSLLYCEPKFLYKYEDLPITLLLRKRGLSLVAHLKPKDVKIIFPWLNFLVVAFWTVFGPCSCAPPVTSLLDGPKMKNKNPPTNHKKSRANESYVDFSTFFRINFYQRYYIYVKCHYFLRHDFSKYIYLQ